MNRLTDPEQFQAWKANPLTAEFLAYLKARQTALMEVWGRGQTMAPEWQPQAMLLGQLSALNCNDVRAFYMPDEAPLDEVVA